MNLQQLQYFKKIAETENFTTAAALLSVTQPALSKAIANLENELNVHLFERTGRNIKLTVFGKALLKHVDPALLEIQKGIQELQNMLNSNRVTISISSTYCIGTYFMPFIISGFLSCFPDTNFQFNHQPIPKILCDLNHGVIDLGFYDNIANLNDSDEITSIAVKKEKYVLIVPKNHALSNKTEVYLKELKNETFIICCDRNKDSVLSYSKFIEDALKHFINTHQASMLGGLVASGTGIAIVPNNPLINTKIVSILNIREDIGYRTIYMGWNKNSNMSPITKKFKDYIISTSIV